MPIFHGHLCCTLRMGRDTGVEPVHVRFTAGCVHRFTNRATARIIYSVNGSTSTLFCSNSNQF